jgi:hypothetical protein
VVFVEELVFAVEVFDFFAEGVFEVVVIHCF